MSAKPRPRLRARILFPIIAALKKLPRSVAVIVIIAAVFLVYAPALRNGFVWDDTALCFRDPLIRSWQLIPEGFRHFLFLDATASNFYRPLQRLTFTADYQLYSFANPWGWHLTSIAIHAAAAAALFFLLRKLSRTRPAKALSNEVCEWLALGAAVVWAIHPLHTSAITYIAGRADPLAALCGFSGLALGLASLENGRRALLAALGAAACFFGALLSKESGVAALLIWFLILAWRREPWRVWGKWLALSAVVLAAYGTLRFTAEKTPPPAPPATPLAIRPILAARAVAEYAALTVAPLALHMERDVSTRPRASAETTLRDARAGEYQTLLGVLLILGLATWWRRAQRLDSNAGLALGAATVAYAPVSNLFSLNATVAEHWLYVPSAFLFLAVALSLGRFLWGNAEAQSRGESVRASPALRYSALVALGVWTAFLGTRTFLRQEDWRDPRTFIERTIAQGGDSPRMRMNLANVEAAAGRTDLALAQYREALKRAPEQPIIWLGYANVLVRARDFPAAREALAHAEKSLLLAADCRLTRAVLGHVQHGTDTGGMLREAVDLAPRNWSIRKRHLEYLIERGDRDAALRELREVIAAAPFRADSWKLLAQLLDSMNQPSLALGAYQEAAERDVHDAETREQMLRLAAASGGGK